MRPLLLCLSLLVCAAPLAQPRLIQSGDILEGVLEAGDTVLADDGSLYDLYVYQGAPNDEVVITLRSDDFDAFLIGGPTEDDAFDLFEQDDDGAGGTDAEMVVTTNPSGEYFFLVNTYDPGQGGAYLVGASPLR